MTEALGEQSLQAPGAVLAHTVTMNSEQYLISLVFSHTVKSEISLFQWMGGWKLNGRSIKD